jgi:hypothetical protein
MNYTYLYKKSLLLSFFLLLTSILFAQTTVVSGSVTDASNKQPMPFVTVAFAGTTIGGPTNNDGKFNISTDGAVKQIKVSFLGYKDAFLPVKQGITQVINVKLVPIANQLDEVTVTSGKKPKYRNKDNPAVELIRKVI